MFDWPFPHFQMCSCVFHCFKKRVWVSWFPQFNFEVSSNCGKIFDSLVVFRNCFLSCFLLNKHTWKWKKNNFGKTYMSWLVRHTWMDYFVFYKNVCEENLFQQIRLINLVSFIWKYFKVHCGVCFLKCVSASFASSRLVGTKHNILMDGVPSNTVPSAVGGAALNGAC